MLVEDIESILIFALNLDATKIKTHFRDEGNNAHLNYADFL